MEKSLIGKKYSLIGLKDIKNIMWKGVSILSNNFWPVWKLAKQLMCRWVVRWKINIKVGAINTWPSKAASMQCGFALNPFKSSINGRIILLISPNPTYQPANNVFELYQCFLFLLPIRFNYSFQVLFIRSGLVCWWKVLSVVGVDVYQLNQDTATFPPDTVIWVLEASFIWLVC